MDIDRLDTLGPMKAFIGRLGLLCILTASRPLLPQEAPSNATHIVETNNGDKLLRNGAPFFIKGAGGSSQYLAEAAGAGANSIRVWSPDEQTIEEAGRYGMTVLVGLRLGIPRHGFNYLDATAVQKQQTDTLAVVRRLKNNPAVLMWALGNELELEASQEQRIAAWKAVEQLARAVKREDPGHPVIAVLAGPGKDKLKELDRYCPSLDAVGINTYGGILSLSQAIAAQDFRRPYIVTEFGPRGHWEVAKTAWGSPIEDTSSEKAALIARGYEHSIAHQPHCLGSYVFLWGQKQEKTATWYGLFLPDGSRVNGVDTMQYLWTGKWPPHRAPELDGTIHADSDADLPAGVFRSGSKIRCSLRAIGRDGDPIDVRWELRPDVAKNPSVGGDYEAPVTPLAGAVQQQDGQSAVIVAPQQLGDYRIFAYVANRYHAAATANLPIQVR